MQLQSTAHVHWASAATDPSKLRSLLLNPAQYAAVRLVEQRDSGTQHKNPSSGRGCSVSTFAYSHEVWPHDQGLRCTIYGNLQHAKPEYHHAAQQIAAKQAAVCRFSALPAAAVQPVRDVFCRSGYKEVYYNPCWEYVVAGPCTEQLHPQCQQMTEQLSGQYEIGTLQHEDASLVNGLWTYRSPGSQAMIEQLIADRQTACVRTPAGQPVAWAVEVEPGCAGMLHTLDGYRRKGLARLTMATLLSKLQQQHEQQEAEARKRYAQMLGGCNGSSLGHRSTSSGHGCSPSWHDSRAASWPGGHVYCYVVHENAASVRLLDSLGLERTGTFVWMGFHKEGHPTLN